MNKYERITIKKIETGYIVSRMDQHYNDRDFAFMSWDEVTAFLISFPLEQLKQDTTETATSAVSL